jgi:excinuclease ABC subunit A
MPIEEASEFFAAIPAISRHLTTLAEVGLGYVRLGQPAPTLSGGEAQRVKLASELQRRSTGRTVYVLDEPTTGLHFEDIRKLLDVLGGLVDKGNSVLVIEHNLDVIKTADWIIDLGPDGGRRGGTLVAEGTPEDVATNPASYTGEFLAEILHGRAAKPSAKKQAAAAKTNGAVKSNGAAKPNGAAKANGAANANGAAETSGSAEKAAAKKSVVKKAVAKKTAVKKVAAKKAPAKRAAAKRAG